ncbi:MAG: hypothetical protein M3Q70_02410 [bacterium]|nr:hypothetical protein [bacterium]
MAFGEISYGDGLNEGEGSVFAADSQRPQEQQKQHQPAKSSVITEEEFPFLNRPVILGDGGKPVTKIPLGEAAAEFYRDHTT